MTFSEIVDYVDSDRDKAIELLLKFGDAQLNSLVRIKEAEIELSKAKAQYNDSIDSIDKLNKHVNVVPTNILAENVVYSFNNKNEIKLIQIDKKL